MRASRAAAPSTTPCLDWRREVTRLSATVRIRPRVARSECIAHRSSPWPRSPFGTSTRAPRPNCASRPPDTADRWSRKPARSSARPSKPSSLQQQPRKDWAVASMPTSLSSEGWSWSFLSVRRSQRQLSSALNRDGKPRNATSHQGRFCGDPARYLVHQ